MNVNTLRNISFLVPPKENLEAQDKTKLLFCFFLAVQGSPKVTWSDKWEKSRR